MKNRITPIYPFCSKPIAKAVYDIQKNIPPSMRMYGDNFIRWEFKKHNCKKIREFAINDSIRAFKITQIKN